MAIDFLVIVVVVVAFVSVMFSLVFLDILHRPAFLANIKEDNTDFGRRFRRFFFGWSIALPVTGILIYAGFFVAGIWGESVPSESRVNFGLVCGLLIVMSLAVLCANLRKILKK